MIYSIIIGILAGYIACRLTNRQGKGLILNLVIGIAGGMFGNLLFSFFDIQWGGLIGEIGTSVVGAVILLWAVSKLK